MTTKVQKYDNKSIGFFERYLTIWVTLCIIIGVLIGQILPIIPKTLNQFKYAEVSLPVAILILHLLSPFY